MAIRVNPKLITELEKFGAEDVQKCYHCGNCSAVCAHSEDLFTFPRKPMRLLQMGLEERLRGVARSVALLLLRRSARPSARAGPSRARR